MPEIHNEIPSDQELVAYLDESLKSSSISLLDDFPHNQKHYHSEIVEALAYLSSRPVCTEFLSSVKNSIFISLQRLNGLPRSDPFWKNTNLRPTTFKVTELCYRVLSGDPDDAQALLTVTAMTVFHTGEFKRGRWSQLRAGNVVSMDWIFFAAMFMEVCGADDSREFAEFATLNGMGTTIVPYLKEVAGSGGRLLALWADRVIALLAARR